VTIRRTQPPTSLSARLIQNCGGRSCLHTGISLETERRNTKYLAFITDEGPTNNKKARRVLTCFCTLKEILTKRDLKSQVTCGSFTRFTDSYQICSKRFLSRCRKWFFLRIILSRTLHRGRSWG
jgi:hypothetical protein